MEVVIAILLGLLVLLLFYKLVERRHKVITLKVIGVLLILGLGIIGFAYWHDEVRPDAIAKRDRSLVTIQYDAPEALKRDSGRAVSQKLENLRSITGNRTKVSFTICNQDQHRSLQWVRFEPMTFWRARSTPHEVDTGDGRTYGSNWFTSDLIIAPTTCRSVTWTGGPFQVYDSVAAEPTAVRFGP